MHHPCLCDICLTARDDELRRARHGVVTEIDGAIVHGDIPMSDDSRAAMQEVIAAAKEKFK